MEVVDAHEQRIIIPLRFFLADPRIFSYYVVSFRRKSRLINALSILGSVFNDYVLDRCDHQVYVALSQLGPILITCRLASTCSTSWTPHQRLPILEAGGGLTTEVERAGRYSLEP